MNRAAALARLADETFDVLVIGGGATGLGCAVDAAARGYRTALIEAEDFASGTSSRSTKLIHGGVRYLQRGDLGLVREALRERSALLRNAPHLVHDCAFVVPAYRALEIPYYAAGLAAYDLLAAGSGFPRSRVVSPSCARTLIPRLEPHRLRGAVVYHDGQFDDARFAIALARTAADRGAAVANYVRATAFAYASDGHVNGVDAAERESGATFAIRARAVVNATGIFADAVRALDEPATPRTLAHSRGSHVVVHADALGGAAALLVPKTPDGRVLFAIPWHEHVVIGTTDVAVDAPELDPHPSADEIAYILRTVNAYLAEPLAPRDVLAVFAGIRPLVHRPATSTARLSREHAVDLSASGLVTVTGGKWTTYRKMAEDAVDAASRVARLTPAPSQTEYLPLRGAAGSGAAADPNLRVYGSDAAGVRDLVAHEPSLGERLDPRLPDTGAQVVYGVREEMARSVEDVLARRTRALFLDAGAARAAAPRVAALIAAERGLPAAWAAEQAAEFDALARRREPPTPPT